MIHKSLYFRTLFLVTAIAGLMMLYGCKPSYEGVRIGAITYSWRSMPSSAEDIIKYCKEADITDLELMSDVVESYAGAPEAPSFTRNFREMTDEQREESRKQREDYANTMSEWRKTANTAEKYKELKKMFDDAGIRIHIVKFSPAQWSDEEVDYAFESAKILGAKGVSNEIGHEACKRLGEFAEKHDMYAVFHNHGQPGQDPEFNFEDFLAYSPNVMLNFDAGHYFGSTGKHPNEIIEKLHDRIFSIHLKDKTAKDGNPPDTNMPWGEGDTPLADILNLIQDNQWDIYCDVELEYEIPEGSDAVKETAKCAAYARNLLEE
jgi:sugar phosphate isomerase/epimerase